MRGNLKMKVLSSCAILGLLVLVLSTGSLKSQNSATNSLRATQFLSAEKLTDPVRIFTGFTNGLAEVIVTLVPPESLPRIDFASRASREKLHPEIRKRQQEVLDAIPSSELRVGFRFDNIPGFSARVTAQALQALQANPRVVSIEPVFALKPHLAQGIALIHGITYRPIYNGAGLAIAICDSGIDYNHPRLGGGGFPNSKVIGGYDFGENDSDPSPGEAHGTCCAGIAAGDLGTVGDYIGGVAYNAKLYALKITSVTGSATTAAMVSAWDWCVTHQNDDPDHPIMVISTSFGGGRYFSTCDSATPSMTTAANNAIAAGITVVASSGNEGYCDSLGWPSCISSVISVGAVYDAAFGTYLPCITAESCATKTTNAVCDTGYYATDQSAADKVASYANVASFLTLMAPGNRCYTLDITGSPGYASGDYFTDFGGTSASCPYVAGAAACLQSAAKALTGHYLTPLQIKNVLISSGDNVTDTKVAITKPRINLARAIESFGTNPVLSVVSAVLVGGNGDQSLDPNECNNFSVSIRNDGINTATNISATLTSNNPDIVILQSDSSYPNLSSGFIGTNLSTFRISTSPAFICGTSVNLILVLRFEGGTNTLNLNLVSGAPNYEIAASTGAAIAPGITDIGNHGNGTLTPVSFPFSFLFYGQSFSNATVSENGNLQFLSSNSSSANARLPNPNLSLATLAHGDDLRTDGTIGAPQGIFTSTNGAAPNRIFNIEWRASYYALNRRGDPVNFEIRLFEGQSRFDIIYGILNGVGASATVGAQRDTGSSYAQFECNSGTLSNGLQLSFRQPCDNGGGACSATVANFSGSPTFGSAPLTVSFTNLSSGGINYLWNFGDDNTSTETNPVNIYMNAGTYSVTLTAVGPDGTNDLTRASYITVTEPPPFASFSIGPTNGAVPLTVAFTNLSSGATNYSWSFGDGNNSTETNPVNTYTNPGTYTVGLAAIGPGGTDILIVSNCVAVMPPLPIANFVAAPTNGVVPLAVYFTNLSSGATNYVWDLGDGNFSTDANPITTYTHAGTYSVSLAILGGGGSNHLTLTNYIVVNNPAELVVTPTLLDFGVVVTGAVSQAAFVVSNASATTLNGTATISPGSFAIVDSSSNTVSNLAFEVPGISSTNIIVIFSPANPETFSNVVLFASNGGTSTNGLTGRGLTPPTLLFPSLDGNGLAFSFETVSGKVYVIEHKDFLDDLAWLTLESIPGDGTLKHFTNSTVSVPQRFYRLRLE